MLVMKVVHYQLAQTWVFSLTVRPKTERYRKQDTKLF